MLLKRKTKYIYNIYNIINIGMIFLNYKALLYYYVIITLIFMYDLSE